MSLILKLAPGERLFINGAVVTNGDRRAYLMVETKAQIVREKDVLLAEDASTPVRRAYFAAQGVLLNAQRIAKMTSSYVGENKEFERQFLSGELELELTPQGTLAEKLRAGGAGIGAFFTRTGVGTQVAEGGLPRKYDGAGGVAVASPPKEVRTFGADGAEYVLEEAISTDFALVHALRGDRHGNLVFNRSARNFSPLAAMAGRVCIAQVEELVEPGEIDPDTVHLPGVYVHRVVHVGTDIEKRIERRTVTTPSSSTTPDTKGA